MVSGKWLMAGGAILASSVAIPALAATPDPLDKALEACLAGKVGETTGGILDCTSKAAAGWDKRLNEAYGALTKTLDPPSRALLLTAQRAWLDYRKKDADFAGGPWRSDSGTLAQVTIASSRLDELRSRVHALEVYGRGD